MTEKDIINNTHRFLGKDEALNTKEYIEDHQNLYLTRKDLPIVAEMMVAECFLTDIIFKLEQKIKKQRKWRPHYKIIANFYARFLTVCVNIHKAMQATATENEFAHLVDLSAATIEYIQEKATNLGAGQELRKKI